MFGSSTPRSVSSRPSTARSFDPTGRLRASAKAHSKDVHKIIKRATNIHKAQEVQRDPIPESREFKKTLVRKVEVPYTRKVKVPVTTTKLVPHTEMQKVKTKKLVEVPGFKTVDEVYTVVKEVPVVREREVWVKKIIKETVMEPKEEKRTRKKQVPTTVLKEVEVEQEVAVEVNRPVTVKGFRVDEVEDTKLVEVEEEVVYEMAPRVREHRVLGHRELGRAPRTARGHLSRTLGTHVHHPDDISDCSEDSDPDDVEVRPALPLKSRIGFTLRQVVSGRGDPLTVSNVEAGGPAAKAGVRVGDKVVSVAGRSCSSVMDFRNTVSNTSGPIDVGVQRDGRVMTLNIRRKARLPVLSKTAGARGSSSKKFYFSGGSRR